MNWDYIPDKCNYFTLAAARFQEIDVLNSKLSQSKHASQAFQNLPRHMRRRNASHNKKRLPCFLREKHELETVTKTCIKKHPSRKFRRRTQNLLSEYSRRQRSHKWLETHIWFAKRFHMAKKWGYVLPQTSCCKNHRASCRAALNLCLLQDFSYINCLELEGKDIIIMEELMKLLSPDDIIKISESSFIDGTQWVSLTLHAVGRYPFGAICDVDILRLSQCDGLVKLWLWVHPLSFCFLINCLVSLFSLEKVENSVELQSSTDQITAENQQATDSRPADFCDLVTAAKVGAKNFTFDRPPKYKCCTSGVCLTILNDTLNRFRLTGPLSHSLLRETLLPSNIESFLHESKPSDAEALEKRVPWWMHYYSVVEHRQANKEQLLAWSSLGPDTMHSKSVIALTIRDPRVVLPRQKQPLNMLKPGSGDLVPPWKLDCPLFLSEVREEVTRTKVPDAAINQMRSHFLVPGVSLDLTDDEMRLPVLLMCSPMISDKGGSWDLIVPAGWGTCTWVALCQRGAAVGGIHNEKQLIVEGVSGLSAQELIDTPGASLDSEAMEIERKMAFFRRPPQCRPNYIKLNFQFPFRCNWAKLTGGDFFVLRGTELLELLMKCLSLFNERKSLKRLPLATCLGPLDPSGGGLQLPDLTSLKALPSNCFVGLDLAVYGKGSFEASAVVCLPHEDDLLTSPPKESLQEDANHVLRKAMKEEHQKIQKRLARLRKKTRRRAMEGSDLFSSVTERKARLEEKLEEISRENKEIVDKFNSYSASMETAWLMSEDGPIQCCRRELVGCVLLGSYSFSRGRSAGLAFVTLKSLLSLVESCARRSHGIPRFLARNPSSSNYFWVDFGIYVDPHK